MATYDEADATKIVKNAIVDYGITTPIDIKNNTLGKYPLELSPGTDYAMTSWIHKSWNCQPEK